MPRGKAANTKTKKYQYPITLHFLRNDHAILKVLRKFNQPCEVDDIKYIRKDHVDRLIEEDRKKGIEEGITIERHRGNS